MKLITPLFVLFALTALLACSSNNEIQGTAKPQTPNDDNCLSNGIYIDSLAGDDQNHGESSCHPWKTISKINSYSFSEPTTIYLKKGSVFHESININANDIELDAYGEGDLDPEIDGRELVTSWNNLGNDIYSYTAEDAEALGNVSREGQHYRFVAWNTTFEATLLTEPYDSYTYDNSTKTVYIKSLEDPSGLSVAVSVHLTGIRAEEVENFSVNNLKITGFSLHGIHFESCINCNVYDSQIRTIGGAQIGASLYAGNGIEYANSSTNGTVDSVIISDVFDSCFSTQIYALDQNLSDINLRNSQFSRCGFAGIEITVLDGYTGSSLSDVSVNNVTIADSGFGWSEQRYGTEAHGILVGSTTNSTVDNVLLTDVHVTNTIGNGLKVFGNVGVIEVEKSHFNESQIVGINIVSLFDLLDFRMNTSVVSNNDGFGVSYNCPTCQGFDLIHNTLVNNVAANMVVLNQAGKANIINNIFSSLFPSSHLYVASTLAGASLKNNCYDSQDTMFAYNSHTYSNLDDFNSATDLDSSSIEDSAINFLNAAQNDFRLSEASNCRAMGDSSTGITLDKLGYQYLNPPSSGAYEYR